jgi:acyl-CoA dehydrogenase
VDFELPEDIRLLKRTVREFVDRELIPIEMKSMEGPILKPEVRAMLEAKTRELGLWQLNVPEEYGGCGLKLLAMVAVWEEIARTTALPPRGPGIFGPDVRPMLYLLNDKQKEKYLLPVLRGEKTAAFAQTEPDAGADPGMMRTTAVRKGGDYVINGSKRFITGADRADFFQVVAATDRSKGSRGGLSMFLVDKDSPGFTVTGKTHTMMGDVTYELFFDDVRVPAENLIGEEGTGMKLAQTWITPGRLYQACRGLGVAARCLEMGASYAQQRVTFGKPLSDRQAIQFMLADGFMHHQLGQTFVYQAAWKADNGRLARHDSYIAKIFCSELGFQVADRCMQIHGGMGLTMEMPIQKMWRDARGFMVTEGPVEVMRMALSREVFRMLGS